MGRLVIVAYRAKPGQESALEALIREHVPALRALGLATDRPAVVGRAADGAFVEVFEWVDAAAIEAAHAHPAVQELWGRFFAACDFSPLNQLPEASQMFAEFDAWN